MGIDKQGTGKLVAVKLLRRVIKGSWGGGGGGVGRGFLLKTGQDDLIPGWK